MTSMAMGSVLSVVAVVVLVVRAPVEGSPAERCSRVRQALDLPETYFSDRDQSRSGSICSSKHRCCRGSDSKALLHKARSWVQDVLTQQTASLANMTHVLSNSLQDSTCQLLARNQGKSHRILGSAYQNYYLRHAAMFKTFFCKLQDIFMACDRCESSVESVTDEFLKKIQVIMIKEAGGHLALKPEFQSCALKHVDIASNEALRETARWLVIGIKLGLCRTCLLRKGLKALHRLTRHMQKQQPLNACLEQVACMHSCACCSGNQTACSLRPCQSCCHSAVAPCVGVLDDMHTMMSQFTGRAAGLVQFMEGSTSPDYQLSRITILLMDFIHNVQSAQADLQSKIETRCGAFHENALSSAVLEDEEQTSCFTCQHTDHMHEQHAGQMKDILREIQVKLHGVLPTPQHIQHAACQAYSNPNESCNACPTCTGRPILPMEEGEFLTKQSLALLRFQQQLPELYQVATTAGYDSDDEDGIGGHSGIGSGWSGDSSGDSSGYSSGDGDALPTTEAPTTKAPTTEPTTEARTPTPSTTSSQPPATPATTLPQQGDSRQQAISPQPPSSQFYSSTASPVAYGVLVILLAVVLATIDIVSHVPEL